MKINDSLKKYLILNNEARLFVLYSTKTINDYNKNVHASNLALCAMGRLLSASLMMGATLKGNEAIAVTMNGNGPLGTIQAEADASGYCRGYVANKDVELPLNEFGKINVSEGLGTDGYTRVRKMLNLKEPFEGNCELLSGEIGEDISYYYGMSEQIPTVVALACMISNNRCEFAGGFFIQLLPNASEETISKVEAATLHIKSVSELLLKTNGNPDNLVKELFNDDYVSLESYHVGFRCNCSKQKAIKLISTLSKDELIEERKKGVSKITCNYCLKEYEIEQEILDSLIEKK